MALVKRKVELNLAKGSKSEKFEKIMEKYVGKATYYQEFDDEEEIAGDVEVEREYIINEFGGHNSACMYGDIVTITKKDANNVIKSKEYYLIDDIEI